MKRAKKQSGFNFSYITVTYSSVAIALMCLLAVGLLVLYFLFPSTATQMSAWILNATGHPGKTSSDSRTPGQQQAHFTNIDGTVRVKKSNSNTWIVARYDLPLEKGDVVQTDAEGIAKVAFTDGTYYTLKPDSLIVVEENSANAAAQTQVAVTVSTGTVDLTTSTFSEGSKSRVNVAGATATLAPDSAAMVRNDPARDQHEILVEKGSGEVSRNGETVHLGDYEKVSFKAAAHTFVRSRETSPPSLISPSNMTTLFSAADKTPIDFAWMPVEAAKGYQVRVSRNPYFSSLVADRKVFSTSMTLAAMAEGPYYWSVQSLDKNGRPSIESERNRFTVVPKGTGDSTLPLKLESFIQYGHVIEVRGTTTPQAKVMVNGAEVPVIKENGSFQYYTPPLPNGENVLTITVQDARGGVNTQTKKIVIQ